MVWASWLSLEDKGFEPFSSSISAWHRAHGLLGRSNLCTRGMRFLDNKKVHPYWFAHFSLRNLEVTTLSSAASSLLLQLQCYSIIVIRTSAFYIKKIEKNKHGVQRKQHQYILRLVTSSNMFQCDLGFRASNSIQPASNFFFCFSSMRVYLGLQGP